MNRFFITGIDTDAGKTVASAIITEALQADYWKPVQSGEPGGGDRSRVAALVSNSKTVFHTESYHTTEPLSPHASARIDGVEIKLSEINVPETNNRLIIEGAGGLLVPLNDEDCIIDLIPHTESQAILVSKHYLGSINHTLLSIEVLKQRNIPVAGIVFNGNENKETESIILHKSGLKMLGRIRDEKEITPEVISRYAEEMREALSAL
jgi:dethiobiotin synthetase